MRKINSQLRRNYRILGTLSVQFPGGKVPREKLSDHGFDFRYFTGIVEEKNGDKYYFLYDRAFKRIKNGKLKIVSKEFAP